MSEHCLFCRPSIVISIIFFCLVSRLFFFTLLIPWHADRSWHLTVFYFTTPTESRASFFHPSSLAEWCERTKRKKWREKKKMSFYIYSSPRLTLHAVVFSSVYSNVSLYRIFTMKTLRGRRRCENRSIKNFHFYRLLIYILFFSRRDEWILCTLARERKRKRAVSLYPLGLILFLTCVTTFSFHQVWIANDVLTVAPSPTYATRHLAPVCQSRQTASLSHCRAIFNLNPTCVILDRRCHSISTDLEKILQSFLFRDFYWRMKISYFSFLLVTPTSKDAVVVFIGQTVDRVPHVSLSEFVWFRSRLMNPFVGNATDLHSMNR